MKSCPHCQADYVASDWRCPACAYLPSSIDGFAVLAPDLAERGAGFPPAAFQRLAAVEAQNFWFRARNKLIVWSLKKYFPKMQRYLEIGCGTGFVLAGVAQAYPAATLVGSEIFIVGLPFAAARLKTAELLQMDARKIPYVDEFDVIGAFDVLEHIEEDEIVLAAMLRALRPGGGVVITVPQHPWLWSKADESVCHVRRYKVGELRDKVPRAGFKLEFETSFVSLLLPAMLASRLTKRRMHTQKNTMSKFSLSHWLNHVFELVMNLERYLIRSGLRLKLGGSQILIATRKR